MDSPETTASWSTAWRAQGRPSSPANRLSAWPGRVRQNIYGRSGPAALEAAAYTLRTNCRNTHAIARAVHAIGRVQARRSIGAVEGEEAVVREVADDEAEREAVRKILHELLNEGGLSPERVAILGAHRFGRTAFAERSKLGRFTVRDAAVAEGSKAAAPGPSGEASVRYATLHRFKGLEADCVIITGIGTRAWQHDSPELFRAMLYVAASRARVRLFLLHRPGIDLRSMVRGE
jgi:superfamily I DNA/RNA helicase